MTKGQVEARISEIVTKFEIEYMGRGPKQIKTRIFEDLIVIRQNGFLSSAEQKLSESENGVDLIKKVRTRLFENGLDFFKQLIGQVVDTEIISIHSDVSTRTGEKVILITLKENLENKFKD